MRRRDYIILFELYIFILIPTIALISGLIYKNILSFIFSFAPFWLSRSIMFNDFIDISFSNISLIIFGLLNIIYFAGFVILAIRKFRDNYVLRVIAKAAMIILIIIDIIVFIVFSILSIFNYQEMILYIILDLIMATLIYVFYAEELSIAKVCRKLKAAKHFF